MTSKSEISHNIKEKAKLLGFEDCGFVKAEILEEHKEYYAKWLQSGYHGTMKYMEDNVEKRLNPALIFQHAKSVMVVLKSYNHAYKYPGKNKISKYALGVDYHYWMKERMNQLLDYVIQLMPDTQGKVFVDSAPVLEKALANRAGLGWFGKNSMLLHKKLGSFFFIGEIIIDQELHYDQAMSNEYCGNCTLCIDHCPTNAIVAPKILDARKCISYLTIEHKNLFDNTNVNLHNWIFGCDVCQDICPWNKKATIINIKDFRKYEKSVPSKDDEWFTISGNQFRKRFSDSPLQRAGLKKIQRNIKAND